jgi:hypothetical protein
MGLSTACRRRQAVKQGRIVSFAAAPQVVDAASERTGENGVGLLLGPPTVEAPLGAGAPLRALARGDHGRPVEGIAQGPRSPLGERRLPDAGAALAPARIQTRRGDRLVDPGEAAAIAPCGAVRGGSWRAEAGDAWPLRPAASSWSTSASAASRAVRWAASSSSDGAAVRPATVRTRAAGAVGCWGRSSPPTGGLTVRHLPDRKALSISLPIYEGTTITRQREISMGGATHLLRELEVREHQEAADDASPSDSRRRRVRG